MVACALAYGSHVQLNSDEEHEEDHAELGNDA